MYIPAPNRETDPSELRRFMRENPLCALVTMGTHGLIASHIPVFCTNQWFCTKASQGLEFCAVMWPGATRNRLTSMPR